MIIALVISVHTLIRSLLRERLSGQTFGKIGKIWGILRPQLSDKIDYIGGLRKAEIGVLSMRFRFVSILQLTS